MEIDRRTSVKRKDRNHLPPVPVFEDGVQRIRQKIQTILEERDEIIQLIHLTTQRDISSAEFLLSLNERREFLKFHKEVSHQLESCMDKLVYIKSHLLSEDSSDADLTSVTSQESSPASPPTVPNNMMMMTHVQTPVTTFQEPLDDNNSSSPSGMKGFVHAAKPPPAAKSRPATSASTGDQEAQNCDDDEMNSGVAYHNYYDNLTQGEEETSSSSSSPAFYSHHHPHVQPPPSDVTTTSHSGVNSLPSVTQAPGGDRDLHHYHLLQQKDSSPESLEANEKLIKEFISHHPHHNHHKIPSGADPNLPLEIAEYASHQIPPSLNPVKTDRRRKAHQEFPEEELDITTSYRYNDGNEGEDEEDDAGEDEEDEGEEDQEEEEEDADDEEQIVNDDQHLRLPKVITSSRRKRILPPPSPPPTSRRESQTCEELPAVTSGEDQQEEEPGAANQRVVDLRKVFARAYSNEDVIFRFADRRNQMNVEGLHPDEDADFAAYSNRLSLPERLEPPGYSPEPSEDPHPHHHIHSSTPHHNHHQYAVHHRPSLIRTPELAELPHEESQGSRTGVSSERRDSSSTTGSKVVDKDVSYDDHFDTASSEIYFSQENNFSCTSASESPPLFVPQMVSDKPPPVGSKSSSSTVTSSSISPQNYQRSSSCETSSSTTTTPGYSRRSPSLKIVIPIGVPLSVRISHINTPSDFWIHVNREQVNVLFNEIQLSQEKFVQHNVVSVESVQVGSLYATRYSTDVSWYRVEVIDINCHNSSKPIEVLFVDYGYTGKLSQADLVILSPLLADKPAHAVHSCLKGVQGPSGVWTLRAIEEFKNSVSFYSIRALFYECHHLSSSSSKVIYPVDLFLDWGSDEMNNVLLYLSPTEFVNVDHVQESRDSGFSSGGLQRSKTQHITSQTRNEQEFRASPEVNVKKVTSAFIPVHVDPPIIPDKEYLLSVISHVVSPSEFYIHIMTDDSDGETMHGASHLDDLREQLNEYYNDFKGTVTLPSDLNLMRETCWAAMFPSDNSWYRVRLIEILTEDEDDVDPSPEKHALVQYIDFGNIEVVPISELKPLSSDISKIPALAVKCHLAHIKPFPLGSRWTDDALRFFDELSGFEQETVVTAHVVYRPQKTDYNTSLSVLLWNSYSNPEVMDGEEEKDVLINALMVNENFASTDSFEWMEEEAEKSLINVPDVPRVLQKDVERLEELEEEIEEEEEEAEGEQDEEDDADDENGNQEEGEEDRELIITRESEVNDVSGELQISCAITSFDV